MVIEINELEEKPIVVPMGQDEIGFANACLARAKEREQADTDYVVLDDDGKLVHSAAGLNYPAGYFN